MTGPNRDLHSGHFGGAVANPINTLCSLLAQVIDTDGRITIPHFYDDVEEVPAAERDMIAHIPFDEQQYMDAIGVKALKGEKGYSTLERNSCRPSFDVCGIWGGYTGEGSKTVLPSKAYAKVSCRLVPHQQHEKISQLFIDYIRAIAPEYVQVKVTPRPIRQPRKVSRRPSVRNRWLYAAEEASPSSAISNRFWALRPC